MSDPSWAQRESATFDRTTIAEIQRAAQTGIYRIRGFGAKRQAGSPKRGWLDQKRQSSGAYNGRWRA